MMYPYMTLNDDTEIVHSEMFENGQVKVYIEKPNEKDGFHHATCYLPQYQWEDVYGFSNEEMDFFRKFVRNNAHVIIEFAQEEAFNDASNF